MKIACIGNMNNMMFPICLYLLEQKHEVTLFYLDEYKHFIPHKDLVPKQLKIVELGWNETTYKLILKEEIKKTFRDFDFFIGTDYSAAYLSKAKIRLDIYMPAGSDLFHYPFKKFNSRLPESWEIDKVQCAKNQYFGIKNARNISMDYTDNLEMYLKKIGGKSNRIPVLPFQFIKNGQLLTLEQSSLKLNSNFTIIQHSRQAWVYEKDNPHNKGNDIFIKGFAKFANNSANDIELVLLEYGEHIKQSKKLIQDLGVQSIVKWIPKMHKDELMIYLMQADICVGNLNASFLSYGSVYESLAAKVAFMGYRKDDLYVNNYKELYPMINVSTPEEVAEKLEYYYHHREELKVMGEKGHEWLINYAINPSVNKVLEIVKSHKGRQKLPIDWKLLLLQPYFLFIRFYNFFRIRINKWVKT